MSDAPNNPPGGQAPPPPGGQAPPPGQQPMPPGGQAPPPQAGQAPPPQGGQAPPPGQPPAAQAPAGGQPAANTAGQPGDLGTRILARIIDQIILMIVIVPAWFIVQIGLALIGFPGILRNLVFYVAAAAVFIGYFAYMESNKGQTVGKMLMKLEVRGPNGGKPTMEEAAKRNGFYAVWLLGIIPFLGGLLSSLAWLGIIVYLIVTINNNTQTRQGWHDEFAGGTWVLKTA